jgi:hydrogenase maturation protease
VKTLVIGYGNRSRRDDGVGGFVIEQLQALNLPNVELQIAQQLEVDAAETISHYDAAIFVDAAVPESRQLVARTVVEPRLQSHAVAHYLTPADLLAMCQSLYRRQPRAILFSVRGRDFNFGTTLTPQVERAALEVVREIAHLVGSPQPHEAGHPGGWAARA